MITLHLTSMVVLTFSNRESNTFSATSSFPLDQFFLHFGHKQEKCEELQKLEECEESQKEFPPVSAQETLRLIPASGLNSVTK